MKPPYGRITAIEMNTGEIAWDIPHGETPDNVKNHPLLKGLTSSQRQRTARIRSSKESRGRDASLYFLAVAVISTWPAPTSFATTTVVRVGLGSGKVALYTAFMRSNSAPSVR